MSHVENISSDEAQIIESDDDFSSIFESSKSYSRSHRAIKKEKRQSRRKTRLIENEKDRCSLHGKRRCLDIDCIPIEAASTGKKRVRHKHDDRKTSKYSSDSESELLGKREKLKMALNIIAPSNKTNNSSTLSHKLNVFQALEDGKKSATKHKKRKLSKSPDRNLSVRKRTRSKENASKRPKIEPDRRSQDKIATPIPVIQENNENEVQEDEDLISLEEQELRLIALKSAVLKKHEARKRKQQTIQLATQLIEHVGRPYSPTDSVVFVPDENCEKSNDCIDSDNNNMDISPISSPDRNSCQPMDMDLASSNENSNSPIFSYEKPQAFAPFEQFIDWGAVAIPMPINASYVEMDQTTAAAAAAAAAALNQTYAIQPFPLMFDQMQKDTLSIENSGAKPIQVDLKEQMVNNTHMDSEDELRAQLIRQMRNTSAANSSKAIETTEKIVPKESFNNVDDTLEEDCLRSLLLSSKGKKSNAIKSSTDTPATTASESTAPFTKSDQAKCDDMPKLTLNLREALKRIKGNQQNKAAVGATATPAAFVEPPKMESINKEILSNTSEVCDHKETPKTDVNNHLDKNENELSTVENVPLVMPLKQLQEKSQEKSQTIKASNVVIEASNVVVIEATKANKLVSPKTVEETKTQPPVMKKASQDEAISDKMLTPRPIKVAEKPIPTKISIKPDQVSKPTTAAKPKPKIKAKPKPVAAPLKPQNSTMSTANKTTATLTMTNTASSPALKVAATISPISPMTVTNLNKIETTRKSSGSPIVTNWVPKPVKKLIISLNADSSSDENDQDSKFMGSSTSKKPDTTSQTNDSSNTFQLRLDQFLQKVRANIETTVPEIKQPVSTPAATKPKALANRTSNSTQKTQVNTTIYIAISLSFTYFFL